MFRRRTGRLGRMAVILWCPVKERTFTIRSANWSEVEGRRIECPACGMTHGAKRSPPAGDSGPPAEPEMLPHRGARFLAYGVLGILVCWVVFAPMALSQADRDLALMREGRMDPSGESLTQAGRICGIVALVVHLGFIALFLLRSVAGV